MLVLQNDGTLTLSSSDAVPDPQNVMEPVLRKDEQALAGAVNPLVNGQAVVSVKALAVKGNGSDEHVAIQNALDRATSNGWIPYFPAGTYGVTAPTTLPTNAHVEFSASATIKQAIPSTGNANEAFLNVAGDIVADGFVGTLHSNAVYGAITFDVSATNGVPQVGHAISVRKGTTQQRYDVVGVAGVGPYTVTVDRPIVWAFTTADAVVGLSSYPKNIEADGHRAQISGAGTQAIELSNADQVEIRNFDYVHSANDVTGSPFGVDVSCTNVLVEDCSADNRNGSSGLYFQSTERCLARRFLSKNSGSGISFLDAYQTGAEDLWIYDTTNGYGVAFTQIVPGVTFGCDQCFLDGGGALRGVGSGVIVNGAKQTIVPRYTVDEYDIGFTDTNATNTRFGTIIARNCTSRGLNVDATSTNLSVEDFTSINNPTGLTIVAGAKQFHAGRVYISKASVQGMIVADDATIDCLEGVVAAGDGDFALLSAGRFEASGKVSSTKTNATLFQNAGATASFGTKGRLVLAMSVGANQTGLYLTGGTTRVQNTTATGTGIGISIKNAAALHVGADVDLSGCATQLTVDPAFTGTITMDPQPGVSIAAMGNAALDLSADFTRVAVAVVQVTGNFSADRALTFPPIQGYVWCLDLNGVTFNGHNVVVTIGAHTLSFSGATKVVRFYFDGSNVIAA